MLYLLFPNTSIDGIVYSKGIYILLCPHILALQKKRRTHLGVAFWDMFLNPQFFFLHYHCLSILMVAHIDHERQERYCKRKEDTKITIHAADGIQVKSR